MFDRIEDFLQSMKSKTPGSFNTSVWAIISKIEQAVSLINLLFIKPD